eukprot:360480-Chlamydomonas_euryale.AAC.3
MVAASVMCAIVPKPWRRFWHVMTLLKRLDADVVMTAAMEADQTLFVSSCFYSECASSQQWQSRQVGRWCGAAGVPPRRA